MNFWKKRREYDLADFATLGIGLVLVAGLAVAFAVNECSEKAAPAAPIAQQSAKATTDPASEKTVADTVNYIGTVTDAVTPSIRPLLNLYNEAQVKRILAGGAVEQNAVPPEKQLAAALRTGCSAEAMGEMDRMLVLVQKSSVSAEKFPLTTKKLVDAVSQHHAHCGQLTKATNDKEAVKLYGEQYVPYLGTLRSLRASLESELGDVVMNLPTNADLSEILRGLLIVPNV